MNDPTTAIADRVALITGGSAGLGRVLVHALLADGWTVVTDARRTSRLDELAAALPQEQRGRLHAIPGDVTDPVHRMAIQDTLADLGRLDLLINNASALGPQDAYPSLAPLAETTEAQLAEVLTTNAIAPLVLSASLLPQLERSGGVLISVSSDAGVEHYPTWGPYGASKAALDHLTLTLGEENPAIRAYAVDPGDLRTEMHQAAFPGEDIGDRPEPESAVPGFLALIAQRPASGRYRAPEIVGATSEEETR